MPLECAELVGDLIVEAARELVDRLPEPACSCNMMAIIKPVLGPMIYFATSSHHPDLTVDDRIALDVLTAAGVPWSPLEWRSQGHLPVPGDCVVIRSCWNYHLHLREFTAWLQLLESRGVLLGNGYPAVLDTLHKSYLLDYAREGLAVIPDTALVERRRPKTLDEVIDVLESRSLVVKPAVSLSAHETWKTDDLPYEAAKERFGRQVAKDDVLVQTFLPEIQTQGELSLIFIGEKFSHAVRKMPKRGDFRVQGEFGGTHRPVDIPKYVADQAQLLVSRAAPESLYARVDGLDLNGTFVLMELELIDPVLFFGAHGPAAEKFASAVADLSESHQLCQERPQPASEPTRATAASAELRRTNRSKGDG